MRIVFALFLMMVSLPALPEAGMISFDAPPGPIGGQGHWYALRTMKGVDYWEDPAVISDVRENEDGTYSVSGEPPIAVAIVLHPEWYPDNEPWRRAIDWVRQAEQMFRNSGVSLRFIINHIEVWNGMPDTKEGAFRKISSPSYAKYGADMLIVLMPHYSFDPNCGIASLGRVNYYGGVITSVSGCNPETLAHELGHNFGLQHDFSTSESNRGYCITGESGGYESCIEGTLMSYSRNTRPFFSNPDYTYRGKPLGDETANAVEWLNRVKAGRALAYELDQQRSVAPGFNVNSEYVID